MVLLDLAQLFDADGGMFARRLAGKLYPEQEPDEAERTDGDERDPPAESNRQQSNDRTRDCAPQRRAAIGVAHRAGRLTVWKPIVDDLVHSGGERSLADTEENPNNQQR